MVEDPVEVAPYEQDVREPAQRAERELVVHAVAHRGRAVPGGREPVLVAPGDTRVTRVADGSLQSLVVPSRLLTLLGAALLAVGLLSGCGGDDGDGGDKSATELKQEFDTAYRPINDDFVEVGEDVGETIQTARGKSNPALATSFRDLADRTEELKRRLDALEPPPEYESDARRLSEAMGVVREDLASTSAAAAAGDAGEARTQVQELVRHSVEVRTARRALARKTGAKL